MMSTHMDPGFLVKPSWPDTGFGTFAERVKNAITTHEPPLKPAPFSPIAQEVFKRNTELVKENALVEFRAKSLQVLIEKDRDTIASQEVLISEYKDKLAESEAKGRILEGMLCDTTSHVQQLREDTRVLSEDLYDAGTQIKFFESELRCKKARVLALEVAARDSIAKLDTVTGDLETTRATLGLEISQLEAQLAQVRKEKADKDAALQEEIKKLAESGRELEETKAKLATEVAEKAGLQVALEAMEAKNAELEKALEEKEAELAQAHKDTAAAKEEISRLEATLKSTQDDLAGTQDILVKEREDFALARQEHIIIQDNLTNRCMDLETSLAHTKEELAGTHSELEDTKSTLSSTQGRLTTAESTVRERDAEVRDKNEEISGLHKQAAEDRERAQANIDARDARILGLQDEVMETRSCWKEEADGLKDRIGEVKDELESAWVEFGAFKEHTNTRTSSLESRVDTLTGELEVKDRELQATAGDLKASDDKVGDLTAQLSTLSQKTEELLDTVHSLTTTLEAKEHDLDVTRGELEISKGEADILSSQLTEKTNDLLDATTALEQVRRDAEQQEKAAIENNTVLEDCISILTNTLESSQGALQASEVKVLALNTQLTEKDAALETLSQIRQAETATFEDRIALLTNDLESKNSELEASLREVQASNDKVVTLEIQLAEQDRVVDDLEDLLDEKDKEIKEIKVQHDDEVATLRAYILALEKELEASKASSPNTATSLDFDDIETPQCNIPSSPEKPALEQSYVSDEAEEPENPELSVTQEKFRVYSRRRGGEPIMISPPHSRRRWRVKNGETLGCYSRPPPMNFGVANSTPVQPNGAGSKAPTTSGESTRLSAAAIAFVPRSDTPAGPSKLRPTADAFQPSCNATGPPSVSSRLTPTAPAFVPRAVPTPDVPRLQATAPAFVPRQLATTHTSTSLRPIAAAFVPRAVPTLPAPRLQATAPAFIPRRPTTTNTNTSLGPIATPFIPRQIADSHRGEAIPFVPGHGPSVVPLPPADSLRLFANAAEFVPGLSRVALLPPQVVTIRLDNQEYEVPCTDTDTDTSGDLESVSSAELSADDTLEFDDYTEAITYRESNWELSQLDSSKSLIKIASLISCPCLRVSF